MAGVNLHRLWPKKHLDRIAFCFTWGELIIEACFEIFIITNKLYPEVSIGMLLHIAFGVFLFVNTITNFIYTMCIDVTSGSTILPSILKPGWMYCYKCMHNAPPRAYHCETCNFCILKRDHHCVFTGTCIGQKNLRYYIMAVFYLCIGALYANYLNLDYAMEVVYANLSWTILIPPFIGWFFGVADPVTSFVSFQCGTCILTLFLFSALLIYHVQLILRGQTTHEWRTNERVYDLGWWRNLQEALGKRWYLVWLSPFVSSPLPGDGIQFRRKDTLIMENIKDV